VLQPACVYGDLSPRIAAFLGPRGRLDVSDVVPIQIETCRRKLEAFPSATVTVRSAVDRVGAQYDAVCCFFLLHEVPDHYKRRVVDAMLGAVRPGGKAVFVDYHRPHWAHPLKGITSLVFDLLEPFAKGLWAKEIRDFSSGGASGGASDGASDGTEFTWRQQSYFGGLFQKVVAERRAG
jgi:SAM-dependent methyltransferase